MKVLRDLGSCVWDEMIQPAQEGWAGEAGAGDECPGQEEEKAEVASDGSATPRACP